MACDIAAVGYSRMHCVFGDPAKPCKLRSAYLLQHPKPLSPSCEKDWPDRVAHCALLLHYSPSPAHLCHESNAGCDSRVEQYFWQMWKSFRLLVLKTVKLQTEMHDCWMRLS